MSFKLLLIIYLVKLGFSSCRATSTDHLNLLTFLFRSIEIIVGKLPLVLFDHAIHRFSTRTRVGNRTMQFA